MFVHHENAVHPLSKVDSESSASPARPSGRISSSGSILAGLAMKDARQEHEAIPSDLTATLERLEGSMTADDMPHPPRAVFDLDDTLIIGDIGEAVFAQLLANGHRMSLTWNDYQLLLRRNTFVAYTAVVQAMKGLRIADIEEAVRCVVDSGTGEITIEGLRVPVPRPHQIMTWLIRHLS